MEGQTNNHRRKFTGWLILALLLSSCGWGAASQPTRVQDTAQATGTTSPLPTETPTQTSEPTETFTPTSSPTRQPTPTLPEATRYALSTVQPFIPICPKARDWALSPDGLWVTSSCPRKDGSGPDYLKLLNIRDGRAWQVDYDQAKYGYDGGVYPFHWARDGRYLYIRVWVQWDGFGMVFVDKVAFLRLNLKTGEVVEILPQDFYTWAFSDDDQLAYTVNGNFSILDPATWQGKSLVYPEGYCAVGRMLWSPRGDRIVLQAARCGEALDDILDYTFILVNVKDGSYVEVYRSTEELPYPLEWKDGWPVFVDYDYSGAKQHTCFELDLVAGDLLQVDCP